MGLFSRRQKQPVRQAHIADDTDIYAFRRSRTMTGSLSDSVKAAAETRADLQSDRLKHHTLRKKRRFMALSLFVTVIVISLGIALINQFVLSVRVVPIAGVPDSTLAAYEESINSYFSAHPSERFGFALRPDSLTTEVQKKFPEIAAVQVEASPWLRAGAATVTLRQAIASWTIGTTKYYIDSHGTAFEHNYGVEPTLIVDDKTGIDPVGAGAVASERMIHYVGRLVALLKTAGYDVEKIELPVATSHEVDVQIPGKAYVIKTNLDRDPAGQVADIVNAIKYLDTNKLSPTYADVRVSSRLYYK